MRSRLLPLVFLLGLGLLAWLRWPTVPAAEPEPSPGSDHSQPPNRPLWMGTASCASAACHNAEGPKGSRGSEHATWATDPHARAYGVLFNKKSKGIAESLRRPVSPHKDSLCLNCHVHQGWEEARHHPDYSPTFGVTSAGAPCDG